VRGLTIAPTPHPRSTSRVHDPHLTAVLADLDRLEPRADHALRGLSETHFTTTPPDGGWSIAQIFEHLCLSDASYVDGAIPRAMAKSKRRQRPPRPFQASVLGGWRRRALANLGKKMPAPKIWRVTGPARPDVVNAWRQGVRKLRDQVLAADGLDLNIGLGSPALFLIRIRLGDALALPVVHGHRHLAQVERTRKAVGG
jgi:hypothetical protein